MAVTAPAAAKKPPAKKTAAKPQTPAQKKAAAAKKAAEKEMDYGYAKAFLAAHPDVWNKVKAAVKGGWTAQRLEAEIKTTAWWTKRTDSQRQADLLSKSNPAEWNRQIDVKAKTLVQQASAMGITLSDADAKAMATTFTTNGASDGEIASALSMKWQMPTAEDAPITGQAGMTVDSLHSLATAYGVTLDDTTATNYVRQVLAGKQTAEGLTDVFREQAKVLYPSISDFLDKNPGATTQDYATPYLQIASKELGLPTTEMNLQDSKWNKVLSGGANGPMTADEWTRTVRSDQQYGWDKTVGARDQAAQMATALQRTFGAAG